MKRATIAVVGVAVLVALMGVPSGVATAQNDAETIESCTEITSSGSYELTTDLTNKDRDPCISIQADDVTFDGNGHTLDGVNTLQSIGIETSSSSSSNVTVRDVAITDFGVGIYVLDADTTITNVQTVSNMDGIDIASASGITITDSKIAHNTRQAISGQNAEGATVTDNVIKGNDDGMYLHDSPNSTVRDNTVEHNTETGLSVGGTSYNSLIADNKVSGNGIGVSVGKSDDSRVVDNTIQNNNGNGLFISPGQTPSANKLNITVANNRVHSNEDDGVYLHFASNNLLTHNTISQNNGSGVVLHGSNDTVGETLGDANNNTVAHNEIVNNHEAPIIDDQYSHYNTIYNNTLA